MVRTFKLGSPAPLSSIDWERDLNAEQRAVATAPGGAMLVIAGAGSGKTRALTYRLAWLLEHGHAPDRMLLMTFTNRAAREMLGRVEALVPHDARAIWGGTFHHVANRILREHGSRIGIAPEFTILDREDAGDLLSTCIAELAIPIGRRRFPSKQVLLTIRSLAANTMSSVEDVVCARYSTFARLMAPIQAVLARYDVLKRERMLLDYDDLLEQWRRLLEQDDVIRERLAAHFEHILVDEYQDTNAVQWHIVDLLAAGHRNLCVVGDDAQAIYGFRGADCGGMLGFETRYPEARVVRLETNYRSTPEILDFANRSIAQNQHRLPKDLRAARPNGLKPAIVPCADHLVQSRFIAEYILHLLDEGRGLMDIAVLYRSHWHAMEIQLELKRRDIPFTVRGGVRFFEQAHIKDVLAVLRVHHNTSDELAWTRLLMLFPRIGGAIARQIHQDIQASADPLRACGDPVRGRQLSPAVRPAWRQLGELMETLRTRIDPASMLEGVLETFYRDHLVSRYPNAAQREQDIDGVIAFAAQYRSLEAFLSDVAITGDFTGETCEDGPEEQHFVTLSTVHQAKGLEWPVVVIPWVSDGRFPTDLAMGTTSELEEERRVFHVAVTRARDELYLVVPQVWSTHRRQRILMKPSRFLTELGSAGPELWEHLQLEGGGMPDIITGPVPIAANAASTDSPGLYDGIG